MPDLNDPALLALVAAHATIAIPHRMNLIRTQLKTRLDSRRSRAGRLAEYALAASLICISVSPAVYYGLGFLGTAAGH